MFEKQSFCMNNDESAVLRWEKVIYEQQTTGYMGETGKAHKRRLREGWFEKYAPQDKIGLDIGCGDDPINKTFRRYDIMFGDGDAAVLEGFESNLYWTCYSSNCLEHLVFPKQAIKRWYEVLRSGGHLIILVPHRDLYEKRELLPSVWNPDHKHFWLPDEEDGPGTKSLKKEVLAAIPNADIRELRVLDEGYDYSLGQNEHPIGEYSIEIIVKKP